VAPQVQRPEPPYLQVVRHIREQIERGDLGDGDTIPSARQLSKEWNIALATATKVLATLRAEGLTRGVVGVGTVVNRTGASYSPTDRAVSTRRTGRIYPPDEHALIKSAALVQAPEQVADALGIASGSHAIRRQRITYRGEQPVSASISWFAGALAETAPRLLETTRIVQGTFGYIEEVTGRSLAAVRDQHAADAANDQDAEDLSVSPGSPVLRGRNWIYDANGDVIEYGEYVSAALRWQSYEYEITSN
jgi:DNA-binding GntR family transcriptional regulator